MEDALRVPGVLLEQAVEMVDNAFGAVSDEPVVENKPAVVARNEQAIAQLMAMKAQMK